MEGIKLRALEPEDIDVLYSIENNLIVSRILDLALKSSNQGKTVLWDED